MSVKEAIVTEYTTGTVHRLQSWDQPGIGPLDVTYKLYAHRTMPSLLLQDIKVSEITFLVFKKELQASAEIFPGRMQRKVDLYLQMNIYDCS